MKKKDKESFLNFALLGKLILGSATILVFFLIGQAAWNHLKTSDLFRVRTIVVSDPSMQFIKGSRLVNLKGRNIFTIDIASVAKKLQDQYPEISEIKLQKRFPDQIVVVTRKRIPFAKTFIRNKEVVMDLHGVVLHVSPTATSSDLPLIIGNSLDKNSVRAGLPLRGHEIKMALTVIKTFRMNKYLSIYKIIKIDVNNLSQIEFFMMETLKVIIDQSHISEKIQMLSLMLSQAKLKLEEVNYIDLRFKEPIMGKKIVNNK